MSGNIEEKNTASPDIWLRLTHLGLLVFGMAAWLSGNMADDYKHVEHTGFIVHKWLGTGAAFFILIRIGLGLFGSEVARFSRWLPITGQRIAAAVEDIKGLLQLKLPHRQTHLGLAGVVQTFGLTVFTSIAVSGGILFFLLEPGFRVRGIVHDIKEVHEIGEILIPAFLSLHVGAVVMHALAGNHIWKRILFPVEEQKNQVE